VSASTAEFNWRHYLSPGHWPTWFGFGFFWLLTRLPYPVVMSSGRALGALMYLCLRKRRAVTLTNVQIAFPELDDTATEQLAREAFSHVGMATTETAWTWFRDAADMGEMQFEGTEHLEQARAQGKGVILLQAHFTVLEMCAAVVGPRWPISAVYDPPKNPLFAAYLLAQRYRHLQTLIDNRATRDMVRCLRRGEIVWFSPDQSVPAAHGGITTEYFGQPALSSSGTARIVKMTGATLIPFIPTRHENGARYTFKFCEPIVLRSDNVSLATQQVNDTLEAHVRAQPEQYLWAHKRFKPPTAEHNNPYA